MKLTIPRADIPLTPGGDPPGRDWYRFFSDLVDRVGGVTGASTNDLSLSAYEDAGTEETKAALFALGDNVGQLPVAQFLMVENERLTSEIDELRGLVSELYRAIQGINQGTIQ